MSRGCTLLAVSIAIAGIIASARLCAEPERAWAEASVAQQTPAALAGGSEYGAPTAAAVSPRPVVGELSLVTPAPAGRPPRVVLRIDEPGVGTVAVQVAVTLLSTHAKVIALSLGWVHTGRAVTVTWPRAATLAPGSYQVSVTAHDHHRGALLRTTHSPGSAALTVVASTPTPVPVPKPVAATTTSPTSAPAGVLSPAQTASAGAVFPVQGSHNFGDPENLFGAPRDGYLHQGQDILTAEGTPVVAPLAGTILTTSYQASGAGYYAVVRTTVGFDLMFAHCEPESLLVSTGQTVTAGQGLCKAGQTGDATAPHLDFEMWVGGWQAAGGEPIDPLPYLQAWEQDGAS
jgi:murein DD-endopeptidase MepM/ murein hydrolase activator NlpD